MSIPGDLRYTESHEWVRRESDGTVSVGITHHAQDLLGDIVFVENPATGRAVKQGEECAVVESVKAASDIYAPIAGEVVAANDELTGAPEKINQEPYGAWLFRLRPAAPAEIDGLLDAAAYRKIAESDKH
ncbi:MAG TPA: glycine cleavage system protein GcvH [Burkholderiales bacterium]|nr:glycine cleavage system protein GcvH [Burkholderiales bacterium]